MKKLLSCFLSMIMLFNLAVIPVVAEDEISTNSANEDTDILPIVKAEVNSWLETIEWLEEGICDEMKVLAHFPVFKYVNIAFGDEDTIDPGTEMDITFDIIGFLDYLLANEPEDLIKNSDDIELVARFVQYGFDYLTDSECTRLEYVLDDIKLQIGDIIKGYVKANIVHAISLSKIKKAEEVFSQIANDEVDDSIIYKQAAEASRNAIYACLLSAGAIDESDKKSLENEELINKYIADFAVGIVVEYTGYGTIYEAIKISAKIIEIETNGQLTYLNELLDNTSAEDLCLQVENAKIKYLNAISNQYADFGYTVEDDFTLKITSYNAYGKDFSAFKTVCFPEDICYMPVSSIGSRIVTDGYVEEVTIPKSVKTFGGSVFNKCTNLKTVYYNAINANIETIHTGHIFEGCSNIEQVVFGNQVTVIPKCFVNASTIAVLVIPESVTNIGASAFSNCDCLTDVYYAGSQEEREKIYVGNNNEVLLNAVWHFAKQNSPYSPHVAHSVMDTESGNGLAFRFELEANGVGVVNKAEADLANATVNYLGNEVKLVGMGAVLTNDDAIGNGKFTLSDVENDRVLNIPAVYLCDVEPDSCAFAVRIINIPSDQLERVIYARPYYVVEVDGEEIVAYGDVNSATCAEYM